MTSNRVSVAPHYPRLTPVASPIQMRCRKAKPDADARPRYSRGEPLVQKNDGAGMSGRQLPIVLALGTTQTLAWASSYYLPAILADPIARDLGVSSNWIFAAFSASLVISALLGPRVGRQIDLSPASPSFSIPNPTPPPPLPPLFFTSPLPLLYS